MHFREWKVVYFDLNYIAICPEDSNWQWPSTGVDNVLALNKHQVIIWNNAEPIHQSIYAAVGGDVLMHKLFFHVISLQRKFLCDLVTGVGMTMIS